MRTLVLFVLAMTACGFRSGGSATEPDAPLDAPPPDATPPVSPKVRFVSVTANVAMLRPGLYGFEVKAVLRNDLEVAITDVAATLVFSDGTADRAGDFRWRDLDRRDGITDPQPATIPPGGEAPYRFSVDALAHAVPPGPILVGGSAVFSAGGATLSASPLDPPLAMPFATIRAPITVTTATDELLVNGMTSLREAMTLANATPGFDRIVFDPVQFPPGSKTAIQLVSGLGELPAITSDVLVIDGSGAGAVIATDISWQALEGRHGLRLSGGTLVVSGIGFKDLGFNYRNEDVSGNNCGPGNLMLEGGAIKTTGGTLVLDGNTFTDPDVPERNCYAASVRLRGGNDHRIVNNLWTDQVMDSVFVAASTFEISGNTMNGGSIPTRDDEGIYVETQGTDDLWITGNVFADFEYSGVTARGSGSKLFVVNNTFVRNGRTDLSGLRREQGMRPVILRNNVYFNNRPGAVLADNSGTGFDIGYELLSGNTICNSSCPSATIADPSSIKTVGNPMVVDSAGDTAADLTPVAGSMMIDSAVDWLDRNGRAPGHFSGSGAERGAVELP